MGGGYDSAAEDVTPAGPTTLGRGVYIMNMRTGERLGWLPTDYSVPADATVIDSDGDGYVDRVYVVDVRAQLYRIDIETASGGARAVGGLGDHQDCRAERRRRRTERIAQGLLRSRRGALAQLHGDPARHRRPRKAADDGH